jgi:predicted polyphosphate/ATP-dependent NAD kinase
MKQKPSSPESISPIKMGLIINPIAGMGGSVGLKGTDGEEILNEARARGAQPQAQERAKQFLTELTGIKSKIIICSLAGIMGGDLSAELGFATEILQPTDLNGVTKLYQTNPLYTKTAARLMKEKDVAILIFLGGDGTARDIASVVGLDVPCLGIPGGVKIHSSVFALNPMMAAKLTLAFLWGEVGLRESEVMDIDEDAFRDNHVVAKLYGYLSTPYAPTLSQPSKMSTPETEDEHNNQELIAQWIAEEMIQWDQQEDWWYLIGPGTTPRAIAQYLHLEKTLLGVDLIHKNQVIAKDLNENQLLEQIKGKKVKLFVTPIGAQGFIFGRGNLQLSPKVLRTIGLENIIIIATKYKMSTLPDGKLRIDSRDPVFDAEFRGFYRVLIDYGQYRIVDVI